MFQITEILRDLGKIEPKPPVTKKVCFENFYKSVNFEELLELVLSHM